MQKLISFLLCFFIIFQTTQANQAVAATEELAEMSDSTKTTPHVVVDITPKKTSSNNFCGMVRTGCILISIIVCVTTGVILLNGDSKSSSVDNQNPQPNAMISTQSTSVPNVPPIPSSEMTMEELLNLLNITAS